jgi:hypothetical protein
MELYPVSRKFSTAGDLCSDESDNHSLFSINFLFFFIKNIIYYPRRKRMRDLTEIITKLRMEMGTEDPPEVKFKKIVADIQQFYMAAYQVTANEVAMFLTDKEKSVLSFACPEYLVDAGMIPVTSTDAIVSNIFRTGRSVIINGFSQQKHLSVFEVIPMPDKQIAPIWKMIGALIQVEGDKIGVIEVSRRGPEILEVGEDFTQNDVEFLSSSIEKLAPYIHKFMPEDFKGQLR